MKNLISSLSKFHEKEKLFNSIMKTLTLVFNRIEKLASPIDTPIDIQYCVAILCKVFDDEFTTLTNVAPIQTQNRV